MYTLITVLIFIACVLLILIVLVQNSKGGGLASNFQSTNQIMGVRKTRITSYNVCYTKLLRNFSIEGQVAVITGGTGVRNNFV